MMPCADMPETALLGVGDSATGRCWIGRREDERAVLALCQRHNIPELLAQVLVGRHIGLDQAADYLTPRLRNSLPDPFGLCDMESAATIIADQVEKKATIGLLTDYDVDGATAAGLMIRYLQALGCPTLFHVPDRMTEGYGPNRGALADLAGRGAALIITLDCGTTAHDALASSQVPVIVIDHHKAEPAPPPATALVNPNRLDEDGRLSHLAAVGVTFLVVVAVNRILRRRGFFTEAVPQPDVMNWLDLVALGTVCDAVPLTGLNRTFVAQGLKVMRANRNPGLAALATHAAIENYDAAALGFGLGPRINAGGRLGDSSLAVRLLTTDDPDQANHLAAALDHLNSQRRQTQETVLTQARHQAATQTDQAVLIVSGTDWHPGIVGIVAGRLAEQYHRPCFVFAGVGDTLRGSGRSANRFDIGAAVIAARQSGLAQSAGGHREAAGATIDRHHLEDFAAFLRDRAAQHIDNAPHILTLDGVLAPQSVTVDLATALERAAPFGIGNPRPVFALNAARLVDARPVGHGHLHCIVTGQGTARLKAMAFRAMDENRLGPFLLSSLGKPLHIAGVIYKNFWNGRENAEFHIKDAATA